MTLAKLDIPIDNQISVFKEHLDYQLNERIIFSGIFGIGKSYFLENFFKHQLEEYLTIGLNPVNYSISNNDDIFKLIKYDILYELIVNHRLELEAEVISRHIAYGTILSSKTNSILESLLSIAPLLNKSLGGEDLLDPTAFVSFLKKVVPQIEQIEAQRRDVNLNQRILDYIKDQEASAIFESDFITGFIIEALEKLASKNGSKKKKVLIIDDLDRIDPEHIFRLFNIFSTHLSYRKSTNNKFGFDKIIFVCDIENIRNIFLAKYGASTDFSGYIDKFYSSEIFYYDNSNEIASITYNITESIDFGKYNSFMKDILFASRELSPLNFLLKQLINCGSLSMRRIQSIYKNRYHFKERQFYIKGCKRSIDNWLLPGVVVLEILVWIYGDSNSLHKALSKVILFENSRGQGLANDISIRERIAGYFIPIIDAENHNFEVSSINQSGIISKETYIELEGRKMPYDLVRFGQRNNEFYASIRPNSEITTNAISNSLFQIINRSFDVLNSSGYFHR